MADDSHPLRFPDEEALVAQVRAAQGETDAEKAKITGWLAASFVGFNAAGFALVLTNQDKFTNIRLAIGSFAVAIILCFGTGVLYAIAKHLQLGDANEMLEIFDVPLEGRNIDEMIAATKKFSKIGDHLRLPVIFGMITFLSSITASVIFVFGFSPSNKANARRCEAIQRDMLSSMPLRSDDPDLFQALGCRPQGEGNVYAERDTSNDTDAMLEQMVRRGALPYRNPYRHDTDKAVLK